MASTRLSLSRPTRALVRKSLPEASFDAVLLDAPCSGVGTLRRHPEIRWRLKPEDITSMASINLDLLIEATKMVKPGGVITYATCTVFPEENEQVVERFLKTKFGEQFEIEEQVPQGCILVGENKLQGAVFNSRIWLYRLMNAITAARERDESVWITIL